MANQRMTQTQLVRSLAESCEVNNKTARAFLDHLASMAIAEVKKNGVFVLPGIGRLVRVDRKARTGRNPATGESIKIPAKKVVKFRVAKAAKDAIVPPKKASKPDRVSKEKTPRSPKGPAGFCAILVSEAEMEPAHLASGSSKLTPASSLRPGLVSLLPSKQS